MKKQAFLIKMKIKEMKRNEDKLNLLYRLHKSFFKRAYKNGGKKQIVLTNVFLNEEANGNI